MRIYLSAQWSRRDEIEGYGKLLQEDGHEVVSRWHQGESQNDDDPALWEELAEENLQAILGCTTFIAFTEPRGTMSRGGRHVEWGYAQGEVGGSIYIVGPIESLFYAQNDAQFDTFPELQEHLTR